MSRRVRIFGLAAALALVAGLAAVTYIGGDGGDGEAAEERASPEGPPRTARATLVRWLEAVRAGETDEACRLMTRGARHGFSENTLGLPQTRRGRSCEETVEIARSRIREDLSVGETIPERRTCGNLEDYIGAREVRWLVDGREQTQIVCRLEMHRWRVSPVVTNDLFVPQ